MPSNYQDIYNRWLANPEEFWAEAAEAVHWYKKWDKVLDDSRAPFHRWFSGGLLNTCYNTLDLHCENGRADQTALIYDSPVTKRSRHSPIVSCSMKCRVSQVSCAAEA